MKEKYLHQRGNCWYIIARLPRKYGKERISQSLKTSDIKKARHIRDTYLIPILNEISAVDILDKISYQINHARKNISSRINILKNNGDKTNSSLSECLERYSIYIQKGTLRERTIREYIDMLKEAVRIVGKDRDPNSLSKEDALLMRDELIKKLIKIKI